jgi:hypothetical protein
VELAERGADGMHCDGVQLWEYDAGRLYDTGSGPWPVWERRTRGNFATTTSPQVTIPTVFGKSLCRQSAGKGDLPPFTLLNYNLRKGTKSTYLIPPRRV